VEGAEGREGEEGEAESLEGGSRVWMLTSALGRADPIDLGMELFLSTSVLPSRSFLPSGDEVRGAETAKLL